MNPRRDEVANPTGMRIGGSSNVRSHTADGTVPACKKEKLGFGKCVKLVETKVADFRSGVVMLIFFMLDVSECDPGPRGEVVLAHSNVGDPADEWIDFAGLIPQSASLFDLLCSATKDDGVEPGDLMKPAADRLDEQSERLTATGTPTINADVRRTVNQFPLLRPGTQAPRGRSCWRWRRGGCGHGL